MSEKQTFPTSLRVRPVQSRLNDKNIQNIMFMIYIMVLT
nr:MAG TPA: hypothetical protein [Caudoviricetes sp.]